MLQVLGVVTLAVLVFGGYVWVEWRISKPDREQRKETRA